MRSNIGNDDDDEDDVEASIRKEVADIKESNRVERRFQAITTKAVNCLFIRTTIEDPVVLANRIFEKTEAQTEQSVRQVA